MPLSPLGSIFGNTGFTPAFSAPAESGTGTTLSEGDQVIDFAGEPVLSEIGDFIEDNPLWAFGLLLLLALVAAISFGGAFRSLRKTRRARRSP